MSAFVHRSRINRNSNSLNMGLSANPVKFVFHKKLRRHRARNVGKISGRCGEHELDWMKESHANITDVRRPRTYCGLSYIAQQHVGVGHVWQRLVKGASDSIFDETFS